MNYIVVPEALAGDGRGRPAAEPSFVARQVLDYVLMLAGPDDTICLAPGNRCGEKTEEELACRYLQSRNEKLQVRYPRSAITQYIDTFGNAFYLRAYLEDKVKHMKFELVSAYIHSYRAAYCFRKAGFRIDRVHRVYYGPFDEPLVARWFYYRYKPLHWFYEGLCFVRDFILFTAGFKS